MIKWTISYDDYNGDSHTEDFYFNLNKAEVMEMDLEANGAFAGYLQRIVAEQDGRQMARVFKDIILKSYGRKSDDGRKFVKSQEYIDDFVSCGAYAELFMELTMNPEACEKFVTGILPKVEGDSNPDVEKHMSVV